MLINGIKFACNTCVKGHRSSNCNHIERPLFEIRKKGRPVTQCSFCRDLRKTRQIHIKCSCTDKSKINVDVENTATTQQQQKQQPCYQCPSAKSFFSEDQNGISYSDLIRIDGQQDPVIPASPLNGVAAPHPPSQCTCHETATKILYPKENWNTSNLQHHPSDTTPILPVRSRGMILEENTPGSYNFQKSHSSSSLRFLGGQTKSPRRRSSLSQRSSTNSGNSSRRSTISHPVTSTTMPAVPATVLPFQVNQQEDVMMDMESFLLNDQYRQIPEMEPESAVVSSHHLSASMTGAAGYNVSSASSTASSNLSSHSPNSIHADMVSSGEFQGQSSDELGRFMMTDPDELTTLLNNVLMENNSAASSVAANNSTNSNEQHNPTRASAGIDMTRSTTTSSSTSQSHQQHQQMLCGSYAPHPNCSSASSIVEQQGESVVITITPLSNLLSNQEQRVEVAKEKPTVTRIVTCYYGKSCSCPGCFVHPNNSYQGLYDNNHNNDVSPPYMQQQQLPQLQYQQQQQQQQQQMSMRYQLLSNTSSLYSSDDEDPSNTQYQPTNTTKSF